MSWLYRSSARRVARSESARGKRSSDALRPAPHGPRRACTESRRQPNLAIIQRRQPLTPLCDRSISISNTYVEFCSILFLHTLGNHHAARETIRPSQRITQRRQRPFAGRCRPIVIFDEVYARYCSKNDWILSQGIAFLPPPSYRSVWTAPGTTSNTLLSPRRCSNASLPM